MNLDEFTMRILGLREDSRHVSRLDSEKTGYLRALDANESSCRVQESNVTEVVHGFYAR